MGTTERHLIRGRDSHQDIVAAVVTIIGCAAKVRESRNLNDRLFAPVDGANCPDAVPTQYTSGSLFGGNKGKGKKELKQAYSLLLTRGLIRIPIKVPTGAQYTVEVISDAPGCNINATFGQDPVTGEKILSMYRRPILS